MIVFLIDENLPRSLVPALRRAGFEAEDVRDCGLSGRDDQEVVAYAVSYRRILVTSDRGVADLRRLPAGAGIGVVLTRLARAMWTVRLNAAIVAAIREVGPERCAGSVTVVTPRGLRLRRLR